MNNRRETRFGLGWALGVSLALHVVLLVVVWLFPALAMVQAEELPEETVLQFDFAPVTDADVSQRPEGDVPIPLPDTPPPVPRGAEAAPLDPSPLEPEPAESREAAEEITPEEIPQESVEEIQDPDESSDPGVQLPDDAAMEIQPPQDSRRQPEPAEPQERRLDLDSALRDFKQSVDRSRSAQQSQGVYRPELPELPTTGFGFGNLEFESRDYDWTDYARQIYLAIWRAWHNRLYQTTDSFERWSHETGQWSLRHSNRITFTIQSNGHVTGIVLENASGCYPLDDSAIDALREVILPPLPDDFPRSQETVHAAFLAEGDVRTMRRSLHWMKVNNYF